MTGKTPRPVAGQTSVTAKDLGITPAAGQTSVTAKDLGITMDRDRLLSLAVGQDGCRALPPGHAAGIAHVRTYLGMLRAVATYLGIAAIVAAAAWVCLIVAASATGSGMVEAVMHRAMDGIDWMDTSAMVLGAVLALTAGVPMGMYLFGLMAGWSYCPWDDE